MEALETSDVGPAAIKQAIDDRDIEACGRPSKPTV